MESIDDNPLTFWYEYRFAYPTLSQLTHSICSIPVTIANVERQFSARGMMISSTRTRLNLEQINPLPSAAISEESSIK
jgi:hypothetical protein